MERKGKFRDEEEFTCEEKKNPQIVCMMEKLLRPGAAAGCYCLNIKVLMLF
jgi:hypothetical protein